MKDAFEAIRMLLKYVRGSQEWTVNTCENINPAQALRNQADAIELKDKEIAFAREILRNYDSTRESK